MPPLLRPLCRHGHRSGFAGSRFLGNRNRNLTGGPVPILGSNPVPVPVPVRNWIFNLFIFFLQFFILKLYSVSLRFGLYIYHIYASFYLPFQIKIIIS